MKINGTHLNGVQHAEDKNATVKDLIEVLQQLPPETEVHTGGTSRSWGEYEIKRGIEVTFYPANGTVYLEGPSD